MRKIQAISYKKKYVNSIFAIFAFPCVKSLSTHVYSYFFHVKKEIYIFLTNLGANCSKKAYILVCKCLTNCIGNLNKSILIPCG